MNPLSSYELAPAMVYWEMTRACALACRHCRAEAIPHRDPRELSTAEGMRLIEALTEFGDQPPHLVMTGGDPLQRPDLETLISYGRQRGLPVSVTPSGTPACTRDAISRLQQSGVSSVAFSLDGSTARRHDFIRGVAGSFARTVDVIAWSLAKGLSVQVNTLVSAETADDLPQIERLVRDLGVQRWAVFFLIRVGRGAVLSEVSPERSEAILTWLYERTRLPGLVIKTTEAHHFRRIASQRKGEAGSTRGTASAIRRSWSVRDGAGIMFISHTGDVYPSGFLPLAVGNVRAEDPVRLYREAPLFRQLRDPDQFKGKCGACEFRQICGGSRARAYAATGDPLESDPLCVYQPSIRTPVEVEQAR